MKKSTASKVFKKIFYPHCYGRPLGWEEKPLYEECYGGRSKFCPFSKACRQNYLRRVRRGEFCEELKMKPCEECVVEETCKRK